jgi:hypothetical protein
VVLPALSAACSFLSISYLILLFEGGKKQFGFFSWKKEVHALKRLTFPPLSDPV